MTCYRPLHAWRSFGERSPGGKAAIVFRPPSGPSEALEVPCGQCIGCRIDRSRQWALRCVHEASLHEENAFITLTYRAENLPADGSLCKEDHQRFVKRLRERYEGRRIRYFLCGEYGSDCSRPHYHALLFGLDFVDKVFWCKSGENQVFRSPELEKLWTAGFSWVGSVSWQSAAYVARYCLKKLNGEKAAEKYLKDVDPESGECRYLEPEYVVMSRRPGIGRGWYERYKADCGKDFLTHEGKKFRIPRYYDGILEVEDVDEFNRIKAKRKEVACARAVDGKRLRAMEKVKQLQAKRLERMFEV